MTTTSSVPYQNMDLLHSEDTMDLASSPRMLGDDLDLPYELDTMRDASAEPAREEMAEDSINLDQHYTVDVQLVDEDLLDDEDMVDEDTVVENADANHEDFAMESQHQALPSADHGEDDVLYDDDDDDNDDDELVRDGNDEVSYAQDVEIVDQEDLFQEDEEGQANAPGDTSRILRQLHSNHDQDVLGDQQITNILPQDAEDPEAMQGPQFSGDSANISDDHVYDQTDHGYGAKHNLDRETTSGDDLAGPYVIEEPAQAPGDSTDNPPSSDLVESANLDQVGSFATAGTEDSSHAETSDLRADDNAFIRSADAELGIGGTDPEEEHFTGHLSNATPLHTVKVNYQDTEICLFPPNEDDDSETFFLADVEFAHQSLDKLLGACHDVLAGTIGEDDELVLDIPSLGLHICQDSSYATRMTLSQILDVYLALSQNEQTEAAAPLYCHLSSRVSLASQHAYLLSAAEKGKTFTQIAAEHLHSHEDRSAERQEDDELNENGEEYHEELGDSERAQKGEQGHNGDIVSKHAGTQEHDHETVPQQRDSHINKVSHTDDIVTNRDATNSDPAEGIPETDGDGVPRDAENEASATSTVRGDEQEPEDFESSNDHLAASVHAALAPGNDTEDPEEVVVLNQNSAQDEDGNAETHSALGDTASSRTIEAGDDISAPNIVADTEQESESQPENHGTMPDTDSATKPADATDELSNARQLTQSNAESSHVDDLDNHHPQDFQPVSQSVPDSAKAPTTSAVDAESDHDDLLDDDGENEGHKATETDGQEDLFELDQSNGVAENAESRPAAFTEDDEFLLGDHDVNAWPQEVTPPTTPSRSNTSKRKSRDDEDEFDLLDSATPDVKRRRPS